MSNPFDHLATATMTVYKQSSADYYGAITYAVAGVVACEYTQGGDKQTDTDGVEFVPSSVFYPVSTLDFTIERGDLIAIGDTSATTDPVGVDTEKVRKVEASTDPFTGVLDIAVYTG